MPFYPVKGLFSYSCAYYRVFLRRDVPPRPPAAVMALDHLIRPIRALESDGFLSLTTLP